MHVCMIGNVSIRDELVIVTATCYAAHSHGGGERGDGDGEGDLRGGGEGDVLPVEGDGSTGERDGVGPEQHRD